MPPLQCRINSWMILTPIGKMDISCCDNGLHSVNHLYKTFLPDLSISVCLLQEVHPTPLVREVLSWFTAYFNHPQKSSILHLPDICGAVLKSDFRKDVWFLLASEIKAGHTISYKKLAELVGNPGAVRAVGSAMSNNPIGIIIPCHRVIKSNGQFGNYAKGEKNDVKKWLLEYERLKCRSNINE